MASRGGFTKNEGDWSCPDAKCGNTNFARRDKCNRCGSEKPQALSGKVKQGGMELGKQLAEKSKGLFSPDDWQCKTCGNVNWARRGTCNVCNTPKVGQVEERTGFGGGFMERDENPDKIERNSDDEEYDEFGRKKKKFRGSTDAKPPQAVYQREAEEEEDDDEDEDSDDDDLGKYAFDSDDAAEVKKESAKSNNRPNSGSSSGSSARTTESDVSLSTGKKSSRARSRSSSGSDSDDSRRRFDRSRSRSPIHRL